MEDEPLPPGYPVEWEADVVLRDGTVAHVRPIRPDDADGIRRFHAAQSDESIYLRFFAPLRELSDARRPPVHARRLRRPGRPRRDHARARSSASAATTASTRVSAEVAFNISRPLPGQGHRLGLLEHLAAIAQEFGITRFIAEVLPQNRKMLIGLHGGRLRRSRTTSRTASSRWRFDIEPTDASKAVADVARAPRRGAERALHPAPRARSRSSARAGAANSIGSQLLDRLVEAASPAASTRSTPTCAPCAGRTAYPSVADVPGPVDLAVVAVPAHAVLEVVDECAEAGVKALLVVSSGFAEEGRGRGAAAGRAAAPGAQRRACASSGRTRFGLINNDPAVRLNASLAPTLPPHGRLGLFAQSRRARHRGARVGGPPRPGHLDVRVGRQPGRRLRQRLHAVLDRRRLHRPPSASTWSRWATRASSPASRATWR